MAPLACLKEKRFQVIRLQPRSPPACTALSFAVKSAGRFASQLPDRRFFRRLDQCLEARRSLSLLSSVGPETHNGLSLARNGFRFHGLHSGVNGPGLLLRFLRRAFPARSVFRSTAANGLPRFAAASPLGPVAGSPPRLTCGLPRSPLPLRTVTSLRIRVFYRNNRRSVRLPNPPDLRSLPDFFSIASFETGSMFLVRYVSGGLLFLKPLGTFLTMLPLEIRVNEISQQNKAFPQICRGLN